jgi:citrate synthase
MIRIDGEEYLTVDEASERLGVKPATLYAYVSRGLLKSYRRGIKRQRLYREAEINQLLQVTPGAPEPRGAGKRSGPPDIPLAESWIRD